MRPCPVAPPMPQFSSGHPAMTLHTFTQMCDLLKGTLLPAMPSLQFFHKSWPSGYRLSGPSERHPTFTLPYHPHIPCPCSLGPTAPQTENPASALDLRLWEQVHPSPDHTCGSDPVPGSDTLHPPPLDKIPPKAMAPSMLSEVTDYTLSLPLTSWAMTHSIF